MKREEVKRIINRHIIRENKTDDLDEINSYNPVVFVDEDAIVNAILALEQKEQSSHDELLPLKLGDEYVEHWRNLFADLKLSEDAIAEISIAFARGYNAGKEQPQPKCKHCNDERWIITDGGKTSSPCPSCGGGERFKQPQPERSAEDIDLIQYVTNLLYYARENSGIIDDFDKWVEEQTNLLSEYRNQGLPEVTDEMINEYSIRQIKDAFNKLLPNEGDYMPFDADLVLAMRNCLRIGAEDMRDGKIKQLTGK